MIWWKPPLHSVHMIVEGELGSAQQALQFGHEALLGMLSKDEDQSVLEEIGHLAIVEGSLR